MGNWLGLNQSDRKVSFLGDRTSPSSAAPPLKLRLPFFAKRKKSVSSLRSSMPSKSSKSPKISRKSSSESPRTLTKEWKTLYASLNGKSIPKNTSYDSILEVDDEKTQRAIIGLILTHAEEEGIFVSPDTLPFGLTASSGEITIIPKKLPKELVEKIYQLIKK